MQAVPTLASHTNVVCPMQTMVSAKVWKNVIACGISMDLRVVSQALDGAGRSTNRKLGEVRSKVERIGCLKNKRHLKGAL